MLTVENNFGFYKSSLIVSNISISNNLIPNEWIKNVLIQIKYLSK